MTRILLSLSNSIFYEGKFRIGCFYEQIISELSKYGNDVLVFNPCLFNQGNFMSENELKSNISEADLRNKIKDFNPELILSFNNANYSKILEITNCPIVVWNADLPYLWNQCNIIKKNVDRYTFLSFTDSKVVLENMKKTFSCKDSQCHFVRNATSIQAEKIPQTMNISFIGTRFGMEQNFCKLIEKYSFNPKLNEVAKMIYENPFVSKETLLGILQDEKNLYHDFEKIRDDSYTGFFSAEKRIQTLLNISDLGLHFFGTKDWMDFAYILPSLALAFDPKFVYSVKDNQDVYNSSKISISINHCQAHDGIPWRVPDVMASNACLVSTENSFMERHFSKYVKIPTFSNSFEARDLCQKLLKDESWRKDIVQASNEIINQDWRWHHRFKQMEQILNLKFLNTGASGKVSILEPLFDKSKKEITLNKSLIKGLKNKYRYKIWKHLGKKLRKKGVIQ